MRIFAGWRARDGMSTSRLRVGDDHSGRTRTSWPAASSAAISGSTWNESPRPITVSCRIEKRTN
jgi:hypothetical protein